MRFRCRFGRIDFTVCGAGLNSRTTRSFILIAKILVRNYSFSEVCITTPFIFFSKQCFGKSMSLIPSFLLISDLHLFLQPGDCPNVKIEWYTQLMTNLISDFKCSVQSTRVQPFCMPLALYVNARPSRIVFHSRP